jgi:thioredoxin 1
MKELLSYNEYLSQIENNNCIIEFSSDDCPPCKVLKPILEELEKEINGIKFFEVNISKSKAISDKIIIFGVPTILFIKNGKEVKRTVGFVNRKKLYKIIKGVYS